MKNLQLIINAVLGVAVIVLFVLVLQKPAAPATEKPEVAETAPESQEEETDQEETEVAADSVVIPDFSVALNENSNLPIAYVNLDVLDAEYKYVKAMRSSLKKEEEKLTKQLEAKFKTMQDDYMEFLKAVERQIITEQDAMARDQQFRERQMKFEQERQQKLNQLMQKQQNLQLKLQKKLTDYLTKYSQQFNYSYILARGLGSNVLYANESLDITQEVLKGLNREYKAGK